MSRIFFFLLTLFPFFTFAQEGGYLFVLFDAGETIALTPVIEELMREGEQVEVLVMGTAHNLMPKKRNIEEVDRRWNRHQLLPEKRLKEILSHYQPQVVVLGVASKIQGQIGAFFRGKAQIIAYYDHFNPIESSPYAELIREIERDVDLFLVPSTIAASSSLAQNIQIVGNPSIEQMIDEIKCVDSLTLKRKLGLNLNSPIMTYIGGYDSDYKEALCLFAKFRSRFSNYQLIVCPHPKTNGLLEKQVFPDGVFLKAPMTSTEAIALADVVICHRSTLGIKALFARKKVIFVDPSPNPMVEKWGAFFANTEREFTQALSADEFYLKQHVPMQSSALIREILKQEVVNVAK